MAEKTVGRKVEFFELKPDEFHNVSNYVGIIEYYHMIGRLTTWAFHGDSRGIDSVTIAVERFDPDNNEVIMNAVYKTKEGKIDFVMGAVWRHDETRFTYHS